jgi:membrane-bound ClpP family serine protease
MKNDNILIQDIVLFSEFLMKAKKAKAEKSKSKKTGKKSTKKRTKKSADLLDDTGIVLIDDDMKIDAEKELEERKAYLEEARSQETSD